MFMVFNSEGTLVATVTWYAGTATNILDVLKSADYTVKFLDNKHQMLNDDTMVKMSKEKGDCVLCEI